MTNKTNEKRGEGAAARLINRDSEAQDMAPVAELLRDTRRDGEWGATKKTVSHLLMPGEMESCILPPDLHRGEESEAADKRPPTRIIHAEHDDETCTVCTGLNVIKRCGHVMRETNCVCHDATL